MNKLKDYLLEQRIQFTEIDDDFIKIADEIYFLAQPDSGGKLFSDDFRLMVDKEKCDHYCFKFGNRYYSTPKGTERKPELNEMKYLGETANITGLTCGFLGIHGPYEILNGSRDYADWCSKAEFLGVDTLGICEKNTLAGVLKFQQECLLHGIKPIIGATYTVLNKKKEKYDIKCYVEDVTGWQNILAINKAVNIDNEGYVEESQLVNLMDGLTFVFDPKSLAFEDNFIMDLNGVNYFQLDPVEFINDKRDKEYLLNLQKYYNAQPKVKPLFLTDAYYLDKEDNIIKQILNEISDKREPVAENQYFKSVDDYFVELSNLFKQDESFWTIFEESIVNVDDVIEKCNFKVEIGKKHLPAYQMNDEEKETFEDNNELFFSIIADGLQDRVDEDQHEKYMDRFETEFAVIEKGGFIDYFLILWDIIRWCKENGILTGIGRGSAGGSLIAYLMGIIHLDPIEFDLLFERFLNEGRIGKSLPDIDVDFEGHRREEVKHYMERKYGLTQVCSVGTYTTLQLKAALKDLARLESADHAEMNYITAVLDLDKGNLSELFMNAAKKPRIKAFIHKYPHIVHVIDLLLGQPKSPSIHACATLILPKEREIFSWLPVKNMLLRDGQTMLCTEWEGDELELAGFLKEDILGIKQLSKFRAIIDSVKEKEGVDIDIYSIPLDDSEVFEYFQKGWNGDTFHFGSKGLTNYCKDLKPENIEDMIAGIALYRPGAMESNSHNKYVFRKDGTEEVDYLPGLETITNTTHGLLIYQEQIMKAVQRLGGFSLTEADDIRKAMGKKKKDLIDKYGSTFVERAIKKGHDEDEMIEVWNRMAEFAKYGFNRSHAAAYAITGYISQWLKVHYPVHFWATAINFAKDDSKSDEKIPAYISELYNVGSISIESSDINKSHATVYTDFEEKTIYWPLSSIKQLGDAATTQIIADRDEKGNYYSFEEFYTRNKFKGSKVNKRVYENLILSGAFDDVNEIKRPEDREKLIEEYRKLDSPKIDPTKDLFELNKENKRFSWWWNLQQKVLSGIAFFDYRTMVKEVEPEDHPFMDAVTLHEEESVGKRCSIGGYIVGYIEKESKKKGPYCQLIVEANYEFMEITVWPEEFERLGIPNITKCLILINGQVGFDKYLKKNIVYSTDNTDYLLLT